MRIAVTGSSGLIGGWMSHCLSKNHQVITVGRRAECDVRVDLTRPASLNKVTFKDVEVLIHCAGVIDEDFSANPNDAWEQATSGTEALLRVVVESGIKRLIYLSTAHVYGQLQGELSERSLLDPLSDYARAHRMTEEIISTFTNKSDLKALIVRPQAVFGIPISMLTFKRWTLIPFAFPLDALYRHRIVLKSSGEQPRNFVAAEDLVALAQSYLQARVADKIMVVNPLGPDTISVYDFAVQCCEICEKLTGQQCVVQRPLPTAVTSSPARFSSHNTLYSPQQPVNKYLHEFFMTLICEQRAGRVYGNR